MKINAIRGKNIASLECEFEIDFTQEPLHSAGFFAITGNTGSGKSSLLDTLCLALFDDTPRLKNAKENNIQIADCTEYQISQSDPRTLLRKGASEGFAEVDFVSLAGEPFRARWSVRRSYGKTNSKLQNAEIKLINLRTSLEVNGTKTELLAIISALIGLTFEQFTRSVLLAQGDFATFLKAAPREKAELLEKLTGTEIYSKISISIFNLHKEAKEAVTSLVKMLENTPIISEEEVDKINCEKQESEQNAAILLSEKSLITTKIKWIEEAERLEINIRKAKAEVENAEQTIRGVQNRYCFLSQIEMAQEIRDDYQALKSIESRCTMAEENSKRKEENYNNDVKQLKEFSAKFEEAESGLKAHEKVMQTIEPQLKKARELDVNLSSVQKSHGEKETEVNQKKKEKENCETAVTNTKNWIQTNENQLNEITNWFETRSEYAEIIANFGAIGQRLKDYEKHTKQLQTDKMLFDAQNEQQHLATLHLATLHLEEQRLQNLLPEEIWILRSQLQKDAPCPVCGSVHHPCRDGARPVYTANGEKLNEEQLNGERQTVKAEIEKCVGKIENYKAEIIKLKANAENYNNQNQSIKEELDPYFSKFPKWEEKLGDTKFADTLIAMETTWEAKKKEQKTLEEDISNWVVVLRETSKNLIVFDNDYKNLIERCNNSKSELEKLQIDRKLFFDGESADNIENKNKKLLKEYKENVAEILEKKNFYFTNAEKNKAILEKLKTEIVGLQKQKIAFQTSINQWLEQKETSFNWTHLAQIFSKEDAWVSTERNALQKLIDQQTTAEATLKEREETRIVLYNAEVKPEENEDNESLTLLLAQKTAESNTCNEIVSELSSKLKLHQQNVLQSNKYRMELEEKRKVEESWQKLNELFGSAEGSKFKLLAQCYTLEMLLVFANAHLKTLNERYELQRVPEKLALQVVDKDMLNDVRSVHSLSGGESFLVSLALALGLSSLSSNKMKVESLFIDEGFGSLDADSLRVALDALQQLQNQGRKIGVISHVAEMTERIATQIQVVKSSSGKSSVRVVRK